MTSKRITAPETPQGAAYGLVIEGTLMSVGETPEAAVRNLYDHVNMDQDPETAEFFDGDRVRVHEHPDDEDPTCVAHIHEISQALVDESGADFEELNGILCTKAQFEAYEEARDEWLRPTDKLAEAYEELGENTLGFVIEVGMHCNFNISRAEISRIAADADTPEEFRQIWEDDDYWTDENNPGDSEEEYFA